jgi:hypothetical protein
MARKLIRLWRVSEGEPFGLHLWFDPREEIHSDPCRVLRHIADASSPSLEAVQHGSDCNEIDRQLTSDPDYRQPVRQRY